MAPEAIFSVEVDPARGYEASQVTFLIRRENCRPDVLADRDIARVVGAGTGNPKSAYVVPQPHLIVVTAAHSSRDLGFRCFRNRDVTIVIQVDRPSPYSGPNQGGQVTDQ